MSGIPGRALSPTVEVEYIGAPQGDASPVTLSINSYSGPAEGTLNNAVPVDLSGGFASFPGISLSAVGTYTLKATDAPDGKTAISGPITISQQAPIITSANGATFAIGSQGSFTVTATGAPTPALSESGALPGGVTFVDNGNGTATIHGNPTFR